jgi:phosphatidylinositol glycan class N
VRQKAQNLIDITLEGLGYLQRYEKNEKYTSKSVSLSCRYDRYVLRFIVTTGYVGWMLFSALHVLHTHVVPQNLDNKPTSGSTSVSVLDALTALISLSTAGIFIYQHSPSTYYLYAAFPIYFFRSVLKEANTLFDILAREMDWGTFPTPEEMLGWAIGSVAVLECMTVSSSSIT